MLSEYIGGKVCEQNSCPAPGGHCAGISSQWVINTIRILDHAPPRLQFLSQEEYLIYLSKGGDFLSAQSRFNYDHRSERLVGRN